MGNLESRITNLEDYIHSKDSKFLTPRLKAEAISLGLMKPEHLGEKNAKIIEVEATAFINSYQNKAFLTLTEEREQTTECKKMLENVGKSKIEKSLKQSLIARLKQCLGAQS